MAWNVDDIPDQSRRTAVVTGANSGIGFDTARELAAKGAHVVLACRSESKGAAAVKTIVERLPSARVEVTPLDLSSLDSVREFSEQITASHDRLDLLINNAGVMVPPFDHTDDGFELQFGINHLGHFALTGRLLPLIERTPNARIVTVSSLAHHMGKIDFDNLNSENGYRDTRAYGQSKLANLMFSLELQRRLAAAGSNVISVAVHPGWTATELQRNAPITKFFNRFFAQGPERGALPTLYAATSPDASAGGYYGPSGLLEFTGPPSTAKVSRAARDRVVAARLWQVSESLTGVRYLSEQ